MTAGTNKIGAPRSRNGRAPTAKPSARLAAATHHTRRPGSITARQIAPNASIPKAQPQLTATSQNSARWSKIGTPVARPKARTPAAITATLTSEK